ncbi:MAG TPA: dipeptide epimerase [Chitinophagaceae bacterium]|nr:dipeptide epimerase [Chitinophagaceae bacterium]
MSTTQPISQIALFRIRIPLTEPFVTSLGRDEFADNIVVRLQTGQGLTGFGECNPYMPINGESAETCWVVGQYLARALAGRDALDLAGCLHQMDRVIYANYSIKSAFDMALHDLASQHAGLPLYRFLGGRKNKPLCTDYTVSLGDPDRMAAEAKKIQDQGYPAIKVKLGESHRGDVERIRAIRRAVGRKIPVRIDANQGWDYATARRTLRDLGEYRIQFCEQPIPRWDVEGLRRLRRRSPIPVMADESCGTAPEAARLIREKACDLINVKLGKSGGLAEAGRIIRLAEKAELPLQIGAFMESRLGMTAFAHLALSSRIIKFCDFDTALMYTEDPVEGGLIYQPGGQLRLPEAPGLGARIRQDWLDRSEKWVSGK